MDQWKRKRSSFEDNFLNCEITTRLSQVISYQICLHWMRTSKNQWYIFRKGVSYVDTVGLHFKILKKFWMLVFRYVNITSCVIRAFIALAYFWELFYLHFKHDSLWRYGSGTGYSLVVVSVSFWGDSLEYFINIHSSK